MSRQYGFTLIELMIALVIAAILLSIAYPAFAGLIQRMRVQTTSYQILEAVQLTRHHAAKANQRANITPKSQDWSQGWEIYLDANHNGERDDDETLLSEGDALNEHVAVDANLPVRRYISFLGTGESRWATQINGGAFQAGTITVCPKDAGRGYELVLSRGGRMRMDPLEATKCKG